jgi:hypothetical protein
MTSGGTMVASESFIRHDPHAPRRRKRRVLSLAAGLSETPTLIYTLQTILR